jgi:putative redox protein
MTLQMYAQRKKWDLQGVTVNVTETEVAGANPGQKMPHIQKDIEVRGNLDAQQLSTLKAIAEKCPVNKLMNEPKQTGSTLSLVV